MSYEEEDDAWEELAETAVRVQRAISGVPKQARIVSDLTRQETNKISREIEKVRIPTASRQMRRVHVPAIMGKDMPAQPQIPKRSPVRSSFEMFAGKRRRIKSGMEILTGR